MGKSDLLLGGKPKTPKIQNKLKKEAKDARTKGPTIDVAQIDEKGEFGDESVMVKDWRLVRTLLGEVVSQQREICWAVALSRLLQAAYNKDLKDPSSFLEFMYDDLVEHLMGKKRANKVVSLELSNIKKAIAHIKSKGLLTVKSSGSNKAGGSGHHEKWDFKMEENASAEFIRAKVDESPVAVSFHMDNAFHATKGSWGIYQVRNLDKEGEQKPSSHMVLIVGYGYTKDRRLFFLIQNSWGTAWGVKGYARIFINDNSAAHVIYP